MGNEIHKESKDSDNVEEEKPIVPRSTGFFIHPESKTLVEKVLKEDDFEKVKVIGKGKFGKVFLVKKKDDNTHYAMKVMKKKYIIQKKSIRHIKAERLLLAGISHPFLISLKYAFHDAEKLYLVMDFINGGEVFYHLRKERRFSEERVKLYAAEVFLALEYLHKNSIIHRDLKPENLLIDIDGHIVLTDFGLSKIMDQKQKYAQTLCGTLDYIAPEMITTSKKKRKGYATSIDWWGLGVLLYEFLVGRPPFKGQSIQTVYKEILTKKPKFPKKLHLSKEAKDLIKKLLHKKPRKRLGCQSSDDIRNHPFFKGLDWDKVYNKEYTPKFVPNIKNKGDTKYINPHYLKMPLMSLRKPFDPKLIKQYEKEFSDFSFAENEDSKKEEKKKSEAKL